MLNEFAYDVKKWIYNKFIFILRSIVKGTAYIIFFAQAALFLYVGFLRIMAFLLEFHFALVVIEFILRLFGLNYDIASVGTVNIVIDGIPWYIVWRLAWYFVPRVLDKITIHQTIYSFAENKFHYMPSYDEISQSNAGRPQEMHNMMNQQINY